MTNLTKEEVNRYQRHLVLKGFGLDAQNKLKNAKVLVIGAGGLGSPVLLYLTAMGVGQIGIVDHDVVSITNLQRQLLYQENSVGKPKVEVAIETLSKLNHHVKFSDFNTRINNLNALEIIKSYDVVIDATDNFPARYLLNDACVLLNKPLVHGSILEFEGHVAVFNYEKSGGIFSSNYRDIFPTPPPADAVMDCSTAGVLGVLPGIIGSLMATEAIKIITGFSVPLFDQFMIWDSIEMKSTTIKIKNQDTRASIKTLIDYEDFCGISQDKNKSLKTNEPIMKEVTVQELQQMKNSGENFQLIDVREPYEYDICNLDGELIPMSEIPNNVDKISKDKKVVIHCRSGKRSGDMLLWLEKNHGFDNLYNLKGGILAWAREIDPDMPSY